MDSKATIDVVFASKKICVCVQILTLSLSYLKTFCLQLAMERLLSMVKTLAKNFIVFFRAVSLPSQKEKFFRRFIIEMQMLF